MGWGGVGGVMWGWQWGVRSAVEGQACWQCFADGDGDGMPRVACCPYLAFILLTSITDCNDVSDISLPPGSSPRASEWPRLHPEGVPRQTDSGDCGVFALAFAGERAWGDCQSGRRGLRGVTAHGR